LLNLDRTAPIKSSILFSKFEGTVCRLPKSFEKLLSNKTAQSLLDAPCTYFVITSDLVKIYHFRLNSSKWRTIRFDCWTHGNLIGYPVWL